MRRIILTTVMLGAILGGVIPTASASLRGHSSTTVTLSLPKPFTPVAPAGSHDLYHCELLNPHVSTDMMITSSTFNPGVMAQDHHAIAYLVPPAQVAQATALDGGGKGWTCFGGPGLLSRSIDNLGSAPWLAAWSPGHGPTTEPTGTGVSLPAGSLIILQIHFNLLVSHKADQSSLTLNMQPAAGSGLIAMNTLLLPSAIDIPCPTGVTGKLCSRSASLADISVRFGSSAASFDNLLEAVCHGGAVTAGTTSTCTWPVGSTQYIWQVTPHMHLLGRSFKAVLNAGTSREQVLVDVPSYDFHYQISHVEPSPIRIQRGDTITTTCTFDPTLRQSLPYLKTLPPRYILWADGSSDEMCLGIFGVTSALVTPGSVTPAHQVSHVLWPARIQSAAAGISIMGILSATDASGSSPRSLADLEAMVRAGFCAP
jgi:hypothetical protein